MAKARSKLSNPKAEAPGQPKPEQITAAQRALQCLDWFMFHGRKHGTRSMLEEMQKPEHALRVRQFCHYVQQKSDCLALPAV